MSRFAPPVLGLLLAPLLPGLIQRVKARMAGRRGPPLLQLYADLLRLARKGAVFSPVTSPVFGLAPAAGTAAAAVALLLVPLGGRPAPVSFEGDWLLLVGLLGAARYLTVLAALDTGSAFTGMGASREAAFGALAEPGLLLAFAGLARVTGERSLAGMLGSASAGPVPGLAAAALGLLLLAENARIPVDDPATHLELTMIHEVQVLDHSGPDLALVEYGAALKLWIFAALTAGVLLPVDAGEGALAAAGAAAGLAALALAAGLVESSMARLRLARVPQVFVAAAALALLAFGLSLRGRA